ncbi:MAG: hypothetical protein JSV52_10210 [Candidatus Zixiibacteriota bacterium]|nr:MAG: hypothetical protein JSV52_10210 [candidate division Zixibacteria bacterium]
MLSTLSRITSRRVWFVPRFSVWGSPVWNEVDFLAMEEVDSTKSILYGGIGIGESTQTVSFADLVDFRGNNLPPMITNPKVLVRARSSDSVFIVGDETSTEFRIARAPDAVGPVVVDLTVIEMGE